MALSKIGSAGLDTLSGNLIVEGNIGAGTSNPQNRVHVNGSVSLQQDYATYLSNAYYSSGWKYIENGYAWGVGNNFGGPTGGFTVAMAPSNASGSGAAATLTPRFMIDSAGRVTMPHQPCFSMYVTTNNGNVSGNSNVVLSQGLNVGNCVNTSTGVFTAPVSGVYQFTAYAIKGNSSGTVARLTLKINGGAVGEARMDESGNYCQAAMIFIVQLSANDTANFANTDATGFYMDGFYGRCTGQLIG